MTDSDGKPSIRTTRDETVRTHSRRRSLQFAAIAVSLLFLLSQGTIAVSESAGVPMNDDRVERFGAFPIPNASVVAVLNSSSNTVYYFGVVSCTAGEIVETRVTVTQESTGAVATGNAAMYCLGENFVQPWIVMARPNDSTAFEIDEEVHIHRWARTQVDGETTDTKTWDNDVTLQETFPDSILATEASSSQSINTGKSERTGVSGLNFGLAETIVAGVALLVVTFLAARRWQ